MMLCLYQLCGGASHRCTVEKDLAEVSGSLLIHNEAQWTPAGYLSPWKIFGPQVIVKIILKNGADPIKNHVEEKNWWKLKKLDLNLEIQEEKNSAQPHPATHRGRQGAENPSSAEHIPHLSSEGATRLAPSGKERRSRPRRWRTYTRTHVRTKRFQHPGLAQTRGPHLRHPSLPAALAARWRRGAAGRGGLWRARRLQSPTEGVSKMGAPGLSPESHTKQDPGHPPGREATGCSRHRCGFHFKLGALIAEGTFSRCPGQPCRWGGSARKEVWTPWYSLE
ncbi:uncharacterized protein LOC129622142 [Bubalus kerabau]|uniref:uncharacterized protein LOC129622142 n=1 Tax=Bubalus carabanensis TaxID=3119969 RepID=UPI00244E80BB|nr:uncharacterized protein LOC129622142 [Bubalus carabanensis]